MYMYMSVVQHTITVSKLAFITFLLAASPILTVYQAIENRLLSCQCCHFYTVVQFLFAICMYFMPLLTVLLLLALHTGTSKSSHGLSIKKQPQFNMYLMLHSARLDLATGVLHVTTLYVNVQSCVHVYHMSISNVYCIQYLMRLLTLHVVKNPSMKYACELGTCSSKMIHCF